MKECQRWLKNDWCKQQHLLLGWDRAPPVSQDWGADLVEGHRCGPLTDFQTLVMTQWNLLGSLWTGCRGKVFTRTYFTGISPLRKQWRGVGARESYWPLLTTTQCKARQQGQQIIMEEKPFPPSMVLQCCIEKVQHHASSQKKITERIQVQFPEHAQMVYLELRDNKLTTGTIHSPGYSASTYILSYVFDFSYNKRKTIEIEVAAKHVSCSRDKFSSTHS